MLNTEYSIKEWAGGRYAIYTYLADCFLDIPSMDIINAAPDFAKVFNTLAESAGEDMKKGSELFNQFANLAAESISAGKADKLLEKLNMEYTALFMMGDLSIPFFESAFLGDTDLRKSEIRMEVYHFFAKRQFERRGTLNIPEDAICHELDYMAKMSALIMAAEDDESCKAALVEQFAFIQEHLAKWLDAFEQKVTDRAERENSIFYAAIAIITKAFVIFDQEILASLIEEDSSPA